MMALDGVMRNYTCAMIALRRWTGAMIALGCVMRGALWFIYGGYKSATTSLDGFMRVLYGRYESAIRAV